MTLSTIQTISWAVVLSALAASAGADLKMRIIPNACVILVALSGIVLSFALRPGQAYIGILAAGVIFLALGVLCHYDLIGGGDVKLVSAVTLLVPPDRIGLLLIYITLAGGCLSCVYLAGGYLVRGFPMLQHGAVEGGGTARLEDWFKNEGTRIAAGNSVPYAVAILGGVISYLLNG